MNLRKDVSQSADIIKAFVDGTQLVNYGYYSIEKNIDTKWYLVSIDGIVGFMSSKYLVRI